MSQPTCFVISPIGPPGSEIRRVSDDLFDLVLKPALEPYDFDVIRADMLAGSGEITTDMIALIQSSELCIIDLSEPNPNVYYECGRRHETARPSILLTSKPDLPFDLSGLRTIHYNIDTAREAHKAQLEIRRYVEEYRKSGFTAGGSGGSLATLATALERVELKIDRIFSSYAKVQPTNDSNSVAFSSFKHPRQVFSEAVDADRPDLAAETLPRLRDALGPNGYVLFAASIVANAGYEVGVSVAIELLNADRDFDSDDVARAIAALATFYVSSDRETEGIARLTGIIEKWLDKSESNEDTALIHNSLYQLYSGAGNHKEAIRCAKNATTLDPSDVTYWYNLSLAYEAAEQFDKAANAIDECLKCDGANEDGDYLVQAVSIYVKTQHMSRARKVYSVLQEFHPQRALRLIANEDIKRAIRADPSN